jgi:hypothetical protein
MNNMVSMIGYIEADIEFVIIKHPKSQPRQIHNQKNNAYQLK